MKIVGQGELLDQMDFKVSTANLRKIQQLQERLLRDGLRQQKMFLKVLKSLPFRERLVLALGILFKRTGND